MDKEVNALDEFTLSFLRVLERHTRYVLVSGYVSILFGRSRMSEDVDIIIPAVDQDAFHRLHQDVLHEFWCLNSADEHELFDLLASRHSIRYARKEQVIPNMEVRFARNPIDDVCLRDALEVHVGDQRLSVSPIELQIVYKELVLCSPKDREDALHLREVFAGHLDAKRLEQFQRLVRRYA